MDSSDEATETTRPSFLGMIMKPFGPKTVTTEVSNEDAINSSSKITNNKFGENLPQDVSETESYSDSMDESASSLVLPSTNHGENEETKSKEVQEPTPKRGSFLAMFLNSDSQIQVAPTDLINENSGNTIDDDDDKAEESDKEKEIDITTCEGNDCDIDTSNTESEDFDRKSGNFFGLFAKSRPKNESHSSINNGTISSDDKEEETTANMENSNAPEKKIASKETSDVPKSSLLGNLFGGSKKDVSENTEDETGTVEANRDTTPFSENGDHDITKASLHKKDASTNETELEDSDDHLSEDEMSESKRGSKQAKQGSFLSMFLDTPGSNTESGQESKEQDAMAPPEDASSSNAENLTLGRGLGARDVIIGAEGDQLEMELPDEEDAGLADPYFDDNKKSKKETMCCSFFIR